MLKTLMGAVLAFFAAAAFAAVDVNKASQADLETVKGIGPAVSSKILDERKKGSFKDWNDLIERVKGVGEGNAAKFSAAGLTVNGAGMKGAMTAKADDKAAAAKDAKTPSADKATTAPVVSKAMAEKPAAKADAKADKPAAAADAASKPAAKK